MKLNVLLVAMDQEFDALKEKFDLKLKEKQLSSESLAYEVKLKNHWLIIRSGVGPINTAICLGALKEQHDLRHIIHFGVGGGISDQITIGDYVIANSIIQYDARYMDARETRLMTIGQTLLGQINSLEDLKIPTDKEITSHLIQFCQSHQIGYRVGTVASGSSFVCDKKVKREIANLTGGVMLEMESAAASFFSKINHIPYGFIKICSDGLNDNSLFEFEEFIKRNVKMIPELLEYLDAQF